MLTVVMGLFGRYEMLITEFDKKAKELEELPDSVRIVFAADGPSWETSPFYQMLAVRFPNAEFVTLPNVSDLPAAVFGAGLDKVTEGYVMFGFLNKRSIANNASSFLRYAQTVNLDDADVYYLENQSDTPLGVPLSDFNRFYFLKSHYLHSIDEVFVNTQLIKKIGGLNPSPVLQNMFDREFMLRLSIRADFVKIDGSLDGKRTDFRLYPFYRRYPCDRDLGLRYAVRSARPAEPDIPFDQINQSFANDISDDEYRVFSSLTGTTSSGGKLRAKPYKILVLGGTWEYHHIQLCFLNYFEDLSGQGFCTYKTGSEFDCTPSDIDGYDLVVFARCRSDNALKLIDYCNERGIATLYMIDDNWLSVYKDFPDMGAIFVPGNPNYDNFLAAVGKCKTTLLYNETLKEDVRPFARHITKFTASVEDKMFSSKPIKKEKGRIYVGYSGSLRYEDTAFRALALAACKHTEVKLLLFGFFSGEQLALFEGMDIIRIEPTSYPIYAKKLSKIQPDLLIAPLPDSRFSRSKCPNKYLESAVVKAACVCSGIPPYTDVIKDGVNGYLVSEGTEEAWLLKISEALSDIGKLRKVQSTAYNDVKTHHTVSALSDAFAEKLQIIIENEVLPQ